MTTFTDSKPAIDAKLAPPGAGLPRFELWVARLMLGWRARRTTRAQATALFAEEKQKILALLGPITPERAARRVLIQRLRGLEDSSRNWSAWMTLDHLRIVNVAAADLIELLARGKTPARVAGTADVKPSPHVEASVVPAFTDACDRFDSVVASVANLDTELTWPHPWFGPLNAARWHFFTGFHMALHRRQIEKILQAA